MNQNHPVATGESELDWVSFSRDGKILHPAGFMQTLIARNTKIKLTAQPTPDPRTRSRTQNGAPQTTTLSQLIRRLCRITSGSGTKPSMQWHATWRYRRQDFQAFWLAQQPSRTAPGLLVSIAPARIHEIIDLHDESKTQLQAIVETAVDGIITINERGLIETFNPAAEKLFGYRAAAVLGKPVSMLMPEPFRSEHAHYVNRYLETGEKRIIGIGREVVGRRRNGSTFPMFLSVGEQRGNGSRKFTGIVRDITDRKRTESQVLLVSERVQQRLGHDLHDGLGQVLTGAALLAKALETRCGGRNPDMRSELNHLVGIIGEAGRQVRKLSRGLQPLEQVSIYGSAIESLRAQLSAAGTRHLEVNADDLPPEARLIHANNLFRIAQEATSNALRHSGARRISIHSTTTGRSVRLVIEDDGRGFTRSGQRGLGLHIMDYRARLMGGQLVVNSKPEQGTRIVCNVDCGITTGEIGESIR